MQIQKMKVGYKNEKFLFGFQEIPHTWNIKKLIELCNKKPQYGAAISAISKNINLPRYIRITDLNDDGSLKEEEWKSINEKDSNPYLLSEDEILFARTGATVGKTYLYNKNHGKCAFAGYLIRFKPDTKKLNPEYLFHYTHSSYYWKWLRSIQTEGVQPNVNAEQYSNMELLCPPIEEQQKIASILSNIDELIQKTEQIIEQTQRLKKGLMQKLLTKGIGHTKFKKTELGEIPEEWKIYELGTISELFVPMRDKPKKFDGNIPWLRIDDLDGKWASDSKVNQRVSKETVKKMNLRIYPIGTVLCSCSATIGVCAITTRELITNQTFIGIYPNPNLDKEFLYYYLLTQENNLRRIGSGSTIPYISRQKFENFKIVIPSLKEQQRIALISSEVDEIIQKQQNNKSTLETLKKGLMQQLLTGKIRVKV